MPDAVFKVKGTSETAARTRIQARQFEIVVDEPPQLGGEDKGPNPVEYVLAAHIGCLNVVGHLLAKERGFELRGLEIQAEGPLNPDKLFGKDTFDRAGYKEIKLHVKADTDADQETLDQWLADIEARCPVSDNLGNSTPINASVERK